MASTVFTPHRASTVQGVGHSPPLIIIIIIILDNATPGIRYIVMGPGMMIIYCDVVLLLCIFRDSVCSEFLDDVELIRYKYCVSKTL